MMSGKSEIARSLIQSLQEGDRLAANVEEAAARLIAVARGEAPAAVGAKVANAAGVTDSLNVSTGRTLDDPARVWKQIHAQPETSFGWVAGMQDASRRLGLMHQMEQSTKTAPISPDLIGRHLDFMVSQAEFLGPSSKQAAEGTAFTVRNWLSTPGTWNGTEHSIFSLWEDLRLMANPEYDTHAASAATRVDFAKLNEENRAYETASKLIERLALGDRY
jgi:hypothetical protein